MVSGPLSARDPGRKDGTQGEPGPGAARTNPDPAPQSCRQDTARGGARSGHGHGPTAQVHSVPGQETPRHAQKREDVAYGWKREPMETESRHGADVRIIRQNSRRSYYKYAREIKRSVLGHGKRGVVWKSLSRAEQTIKGNQTATVDPKSTNAEPAVASGRAQRQVGVARWKSP